MTAFDNIKTNNWPATSNDLEDFLVLEMPLNNEAALTSSRRDIVAGSKVLFPKRTLTNTGVAALEAGLYSGNSSGGAFYSTTSWADAFDGALNTGPFVYSTTTNTLTLPPGVTWSNKIRVHALRYDGAFEINGTDILASHTIGNNAAWYDLTATLGSSGTLSTIMIGGVNTTYMKLMAVELDDQILIDPPGGPKKHYNNNADFGSISDDKYLTVPASPDFAFGTAPWCIECWANIRSTPTNGTAIWDFNTNVGFSGNEEWISAYCQGTNVYFYWGSGSYDGIFGSFTANNWHHWAWTWDGTTARLFRDGTVVADTTTTNKSAGWGSPTRDIYIGKQNYDSPNRFGDQQIQDLRIYKGVAKYTSNFTPPGAILS